MLMKTIGSSIKKTQVERGLAAKKKGISRLWGIVPGVRDKGASRP